MEVDIQKRQSAEGARTDSDVRKRRVKRAQKAMYVKGKPITSKYIDNLLGDESLVPTRVCPIPLIYNKGT